MKIMLVVAAVMFVVTAAYADVPRADRPVWSVGDTWTYQTTDAEGQIGERTNTVVKIEPFNGATAYFVSFTGIKELSVFDEDINVVAFVDPASGAVVGERQGLRYWSWPLEVGMTWAYSGTQTVGGRTTSVQATVSVEAYEDLTVPAGAFGAFRVVVRSRVSTPEGRKFDQTETNWWAPAAGNSVKYSRTTSTTGFRESRELVRFTFAGAK